MTQTAKTSAAIGCLLIIVIIAVAIASSSDSKATAVDPPFDLADPASPQTAILDAWRDADLDPGGFAPIEVSSLGDATCDRGAVDGLEVILCSYETASAAAERTGAAQKLIGDATGAALVAGESLVVVVDRNVADRDGKRINTLLNSFRETAIARAQ